MRKIATFVAVPLLASLLVLSTSPSAIASGSNGGSGGGSNGGGGNPPPSSGPIGNVGLNPNPLVGGQPSTFFVAFTFAGPTPAAGVDLLLRSNDPAVQVPATYHVPGGVFSVDIPITTANVTTQRTVSATVSSGAQSKTATATMFPLHATFVGVKLQSPGDGAGLGFRILTKFDWAAQANAWGYELQIASNPAFDPADVMDVVTPNAFWAASYFNGAGLRYWRVRAMDAAGAPGPWSLVRRFTAKPQ